MSGCPTHAQLVGGYVLRALDPAEMEDMRRHAAECPYCGPETRAFSALPGLLDQIEPADVPPPSLSPEVEEAVLDRFARERRGEAHERRPLLTPQRIVALAVVSTAVLALVLALVWPSDDGRQRGAYASVRLAPLVAGSAASGRAYADAVPAGTRVWLHARGLGRERRFMYELWCVRADGRWVSGGTFSAGSRGEAKAELTAAVSPGDYHVMIVTRRPATAPERGRGTAVLRGRLTY